MSKFFSRLPNTIKKLNNISIILGLLAITLIMISVYKFIDPIKETFIDERDKFIIHTGPNIRDKFYSEIYDDIRNDNTRGEYEVGKIVEATSPTLKSWVLDISTGPGHRVDILNHNNIPAIGIDESSDMITLAKNNYPHASFKKGSIMSSMQFEPNSFTHILSIDFTLYYIENKSVFFQNCYNYLMPGGHIVIHLVDRAKIKSLLKKGEEAQNPNFLSNIYSKKNNNYDQNDQLKKENHSVARVKFANFEYKSDYKHFQDKDMSLFTESFIYPEGKTRQNEHKLYMPTQERILATAKSVGFILDSKISLSKTGFEHQFLYVLQKPE